MGTANRATIIARKEILDTKLMDLCSSFSSFDIRIDTPIDDSIITEIELITSNLTNAEPKYIPRNPMMRANAAISPLIFKEWFTFFWKRNHPPIPAKIIKIEKK